MEVKASIKRGEVQAVTVDGRLMQKVEGGHCRQVFTDGDLYVKFDNPSMHDCSSLQSKWEIENLAEIDESDKHFFVLPEAFGKIDGLYYVVQKAVRNEVELNNFHKNQLAYLKMAYSLSDVGHLNGKPYNMVVTAAGIKVYDYAFLGNNA